MSLGFNLARQDQVELTTKELAQEIKEIEKSFVRVDTFATYKEQVLRELDNIQHKLDHLIEEL